MKVKVYEKKVAVTLNTGGDGFFCRAKRSVRLHNLVLIHHTGPDMNFGELRAQFIPEDWDRTQHGLIYTDRQFMHELRTWFETEFKMPHLVAKTVEYSEQGMQGRDYVSMDVPSAFIHHFLRNLE